MFDVKFAQAIEELEQAKRKVKELKEEAKKLLKQGKDLKTVSYVKPKKSVDKLKLEKNFRKKYDNVPVIQTKEIDYNKLEEKFREKVGEPPYKVHEEVDYDKLVQLAKSLNMDIPTKITRKGYVRKNSREIDEIRLQQKPTF
jgi:HD superfamily phosphohydrolase